MAVLRTLESKIEGLFEGIFGRAFRTHVQPIELARKLVKEMDDHRNVSVANVYVPNEYTVYLSPDDRKQLEGYEEALVAELQEYLAEHARREKYSLLGPPKVLVTVDGDLAVGEFGIATRLVAGAEEPGAVPPPPSLPLDQPAQTMIYKAPPPDAPEPPSPPPEPPREVVTLTVSGRTHEVTSPSVVLGRSREADVRVADVNASRRHAELRQEDSSYWIVDLGSTNGIEVNGKRVDRARLQDGDRITIGTTEVVFGRSQPS